MPIYTPDEKAEALERVQSHFDLLEKRKTAEEINHGVSFVQGFVTCLLRTGCLTDTEHDAWITLLRETGARKLEELSASPE